MKIAGVIAEYNPFHSGHEYHIRQTRLRTACDYVVVCMDGSFVQRGEAACLSKWTRARMALMCGADAVFELPALFAVRTADAFARGGVAILDGLGADVLCFGSESADAALPERLAEIREREPDCVAEGVRRRLNAGVTHARAWGEAAAAYLGVPAEQLNAPNLVLGAEYIRAIRALGSKMAYEPVLRVGAYHDTCMDGGGYASATAIRTALSEGRHEAAMAHVPECVRDLLRDAGGVHAPDDLLLYRLRSMSEAEIAALPDVAEGLEYRARHCAESAGTVSEWIEAVKCKRYTRARLMRLGAHAMLGMTDALTKRHPTPEYARLIGVRADARPLLKELKARSRLPIISDGMQIADNEIFQMECRATDLRALLCDRAEDRRAGQEFTQKFVRVE